MRRIAGPPPRALRRLRIQENLHIGVREHRRSDVAAFHHDVPVRAQGALTGHQHGTDLRQARNRRGRRIPRRRTNRLGHVVIVDFHPAARQIEARLRGETGHRRLVLERDALMDRQPADGAIHGAGIDVGKVEVLRQRARNRTLASAGWSIDRDNHNPNIVPARPRSRAAMH